MVASPVRGRSNLPSALALVGANLLTLVAAIIIGWDIATIVVLFWIENLVVGAFAVLRIVAATRRGAWFLAPAFTFLYALFCYLHAAFVIVLFLGDPTDLGGGAGAAALRALAAEVAPAALVLLASHAVSFLANFIVGGEMSRIRAVLRSWRESAPSARRWEARLLRGSMSGAVSVPHVGRELIVGPFRRVLTLQATIVATALVLVFVQATFVAAVILVLVKTVIDLQAHLAERRRYARFDVVRAAPPESA